MVRVCLQASRVTSSMFVDQHIGHVRAVAHVAISYPPCRKSAHRTLSGRKVRAPAAAHWGARRGASGSGRLAPPELGGETSRRPNDSYLHGAAAEVRMQRCTSGDRVEETRSKQRLVPIRYINSHSISVA